MICNPETVLQRRGHIFEAHTDTLAATNTKTIEIDGVDDFHLLEGSRLLIRFTNGNTSSTMRLTVDGVTADLVNANGLTTWGENSISANTTVLVTYSRDTSLFKATTLFSSTVSISIDGSNVLEGAITDTKLATNSVTTSKIVNNAVTNDKILTQTITYDRINGSVYSMINVDILFPLSVGSYYTINTAISAIPVAYRKKNLIISFFISANVSTMFQFQSESVSDWSDTDYWAPFGGTRMVQKARNVTGVDVPKGTFVYINSSSGTNPTFLLASTTTYNSAIRTFGITATAITSNSMGDIIEEGMITNINTGSYTPGTELWLSTSGGYTGTMPTAPTAKVSIGMVIKQNSNSGSIYVKLRPLYNFVSSSDVKYETYSSGSIPRFTSNNRFEQYALKQNTFNSTIEVPIADYYTPSTARASVPSTERFLGKEVKYLQLVNKIDTLTITGTASVSGNITVNLGNGVSNTIAITSGATQTSIASLIAAATYTGYTVTVNSNVITFTKTTLGTAIVPVFTSISGVTGVVSNVQVGTYKNWRTDIFIGNNISTWSTDSSWETVHTTTGTET